MSLEKLYATLMQMSESEIVTLMTHLRTVEQDMDSFPKDADGHTLEAVSTLRDVVSYFNEGVQRVYFLNTEGGRRAMQAIRDEIEKEDKQP